MGAFNNSVTQQVDQLERVHEALLSTRASSLAYAASGDPVRLVEYDKDRARLRQQLPGLRTISASHQVEAEHVIAASDRWLDAVEHEVDVRRAGGQPNFFAPREEFAATYDAFSALRDVLHAERDRRWERAGRVIRTGQAIGLATAIIGIVYPALLLRRVLHRFTDPLQRLVEVVERQRRGDPTVQADPHDGSIEVRSLASELNRLAERNADLVAAQARALDLYAMSAKVAAAMADKQQPDWNQAVSTMVIGVGVHHGVIFEVSPSGFMSTLASEAGPGAESWTSLLDGLNVKSPDLAPLHRGQVQAVARKEDLATVFPPVLAELARAEKREAWALVPLTMGDELVGVLSISSMIAHRWSPQEVESIERCAAYMAQALGSQRVMASLREVEAQQALFMATTSHELRTPLTTIAGYLEMMQDGDLGDLTRSQLNATDVISRNVVRLRILIEDLLTLNRLDSGHTRVHERLFPIAEVIDAATEAVRIQADIRGVQLDVETPPSNLLVHGDPESMERVLINLLSNGVKFTKTGGQVTLSTQFRAKEGHLRIDVVDTGIGIPEAELPRVFDRFVRASNATKQEVPGTGLGLAIVKSLVEAQGGTVRVTSVEGEGTHFVVEVPARHAAVALR